MAWFNKPENQHLVFNIDIKANNDPERLFTLMKKILASTSPDWESTIAPRLILGLWHPKFVAPSLTILPSLKKCFIGIDLTLAQYPVFWDSCDAFSIAFPILASSQGKAFREKCKSKGKSLYTWTCNKQEEWATAASWGIDVVMTDVPIPYMAERRAVVEAKKPIVPRDSWFMWRSLFYYTPVHWIVTILMRKRLVKLGGPITAWIPTRWICYFSTLQFSFFSPLRTLYTDTSFVCSLFVLPLDFCLTLVSLFVLCAVARAFGKGIIIICVEDRWVLSSPSPHTKLSHDHDNISNSRSFGKFLVW